MGVARGFMDEFFQGGNRPVRKNPDSKFSIVHDKWDKEDYEAIVNEIKELEVAGDQLADFVPTGGPAMGDAFHGLKKALVKTKADGDIRPSHLVNKVVSNEFHELKEYEELRMHTTGDVVAAGLGCVTMEPKLEVLFDKLRDEQQALSELEAMAAEAGGMGEELDDLDDMIAQALADGDQEAAEDYQKQQAKIQEALDKLKEQMEAAADAVDEQIAEKIPKVKEIVKDAVGEALEEAENLDSLDSTWGLDPGMLQALPAQRRIELAKKFNTDKFKRIADLLGAMQRLAIGEQQKKVTTARDEIYDVELGADLTRVLPMEMLAMGDEDLDIVFFNRLIERSLPQYKLRGEEKIAKGDIICCIDDSGSMGGDAEPWAKAVALALLAICKLQNRGFTGIHFGSPGETKTYEFDKKDWSASTRYLRGGQQPQVEPHLNQLEAVISFAETFFNSGTDFMTPLSMSVERLRSQYGSDGAVKGDIVFITDGICGVSDEWMNEFKEAQEEMGFRVWGVIIGGNPESEPLRTICDTRVFTIKNLLDGTEVRDIFRRV